MTRNSIDLKEITGGGCGQVSFGSEQGSAMGTCEYGMNSVASIKSREFD
jgi:hypothetical protein